MYHTSAAPDSEVLFSRRDSEGATASLSSSDTQKTRIGNFLFNGEKVEIQKGSIAFVHNYIHYQNAAIVMDEKFRFVCIPLSCVKEDGNPEGEKWFSPMALASTQAEPLLKRCGREGGFVVYSPTYNTDITPYELSLLNANAEVVHFPIYKFEDGKIGFRDEDKRFKNLRDLVEYHRGNRGILDTRLKKASTETEDPVSFGDLEIEASEVEIEQGELGSSCFATLHQGMHKNKIATIKKPKSDLRSVEATIEEGRVLAPLKHDHVIRMLGVIKREEPCLVLESLLDGDLNWWLKQAGASLQSGMQLAICLQVALAVKYLHEQRIVLHRDVAAHSCQVTSVSDEDVSQDQ